MDLSPKRKTCKMCNTEQSWQFLKLAKDGRWIYCDDKGKRWNGKCCPTCFLAQNRANKAKARGR